MMPMATRSASPGPATDAALAQLRVVHDICSRLCAGQSPSIAEPWSAQGQGAGRDHPSLHRHGKRAGGARPALRSRRRKSRRIISSMKTAAFFSSCPRRAAPGMPAQSCWAGETDMNSASIGIEIENGGLDFGAPAYPEAQIEALIALCRDIMRRHAIAPSRVLAHSDIAPGRKIDPGEYFPWGQLAAAGIGHYVRPHAIGEDVPLAAGAGGEKVQNCRRCWQPMAMTSASAANTTSGQNRWSPLSSDISVQRGLMERRIARLSRRCGICWGRRLDSPRYSAATGAPTRA